MLHNVAKMDGITREHGRARGYKKSVLFYNRNIAGTIQMDIEKKNWSKESREG